jgi:hypothetical protein
MDMKGLLSAVIKHTVYIYRCPGSFQRLLEFTEYVSKTFGGRIFVDGVSFASAIVRKKEIEIHRQFLCEAPCECPLSPAPGSAPELSVIGPVRGPV